MTEENITLYFTQGSSDKIYQAQLEQTAEGWLVNFQYGRRGKPLTTGTKTKDPIAYDEAKAAYDKLVNSKTSKGYTPDNSGAAYSGTEKAGDVTTFQPQLLNPITGDDLLTQLQKWGQIALQTKHDGERRGLLLEGSSTVGANRKGLRVALRDDVNATLQSVMTDLEAEFDTEDMGDHVVVFDILSWNGKSVTNQPFEDRAQLLASLNDYLPLSCAQFIKVDVPTFVTTIEDANTFILNAQTNNEEGVVLRNPKAPYNAGKPASGGDALKLKFIESATVRVLNPHPTKRSAALEVLSDGAWVGVGNVTIPSNYDIPQKGDLVEVEYLYAYPGGSLYQPVYRGKRTDIDETDATIEQLKFK